MTTPQEAPQFIRGQSIARFSSYADAQRAVDYLSDEGFPVENLTIVGSDLRQVERVTGRLTNWKAALVGAGTGAWFGALIGLILSLFARSGTGVILIILWAALYGLVFGAIWGFVAHLFSRGERDFSTLGATIATRFEVYCTPDYAERAGQMLAQMPASRST